jgi:disulfide bond formation protein DsbB
MAAIPLRAALALFAVAVAGALGMALASEWWGGLVPCALCLVGRWPYRVAIGFALLGIVAPPRWRMACAAGALGSMVASAGIGAVHVGVEAKLWPSPLPGCVVRFTPGAGLADLPARPAKPCDDPAYLLEGVPVSMAAMSLLFSLGGIAGLGAAILGRRGAG